MVICPVAIVAGCKKCPIFKICPAKGIIGDQKSAEEEKPAKSTAPAKKPKKR